jgi:tubulin polyglutamylase complex subunit 2
MERREEFDRVALSCITYLESFSECRNVNFQCGEGAASHESLVWEKKSAPYKLPKDLKNFLSLFNGVHLSWSVDIAGRNVQIGELRVNRIDAIKPLDMEGTIDTRVWSDIGPRVPDTKQCAAFVLDSQCEVGEVVLLYRVDRRNASVDSGDGVAAEQQMDESFNEEPEVWFVDQSARWHYISKTFTQYFRLMVIHVGIHGWQLAFTPEGVPPVTQQWMGLFCKERLIVDKYWRDRLLYAPNKSS